MRQHITPKQLNELSKEGKAKLRKWCFNYPEEDGRWDEMLLVDLKTNVIHSLSEEHLLHEWLEKAYPLLSIGQMFEFLNKNDKKAWGWYFSDGPHVTKDIVGILWEACKEVLNEN